MTEEKRIIVSEHGALSCTFPLGTDQPFWEFGDYFPPEPITKSEFKNFVVKSMLGFNKQIIEFIGVDEFWDMYSKPVPEQKYNVIVPHTKNNMYCKNDLGLSVVSDDTDLDNCEFTEAEIKKFYLEDCERIPVDE